ncbi:MAG: type II toxin-antitoxin system RelE/ParE family toxin [Acidobacteriaceae bacterium]
MRIVWSRRAIQHLVAIRAYIGRDSQTAAQSLVLQIVGSVEQLRQYPNAGRAGRVKGTRELVISATPYIVPYRIRQTSIEIIAVFHGRQRWPEIL